LSDTGFIDYISDIFNLNDLMMIIMTWVYCMLRLNTEDFGANFVLVRNFNNIDFHEETEYILDILSKPENDDYAK